jgi:hypothetical protein
MRLLEKEKQKIAKMKGKIKMPSYLSESLPDKT